MSESQETLVSLRNVGLKYKLKRPINGSKVFWALKDVSFEINKGDTLGVIGSNGAGKSTLMKLIAGIIQQDHGIVERRPDLRILLLTIGLGFESTLTGRENAILGGMLLGLHRRTIEKRLPRIIEFSELGEFIDQPIYTYSSGMMARLGFAVAMEVDPDVLLLDEVMGVGDMHFSQKSTAALKEKVNSDMTAVVISHAAATIRAMCNKAIWVHHGVTQCAGEIEDVVPRYEKFMQTGVLS